MQDFDKTLSEKIRQTLADYQPTASEGQWAAMQQKLAAQQKSSARRSAGWIGGGALGILLLMGCLFIHEEFKSADGPKMPPPALHAHTSPSAAEFPQPLDSLLHNPADRPLASDEEAVHAAGMNAHTHTKHTEQLASSSRTKSTQEREKERANTANARTPALRTQRLKEEEKDKRSEGIQKEKISDNKQLIGVAKEKVRSEIPSDALRPERLPETTLPPPQMPWEVIRPSLVPPKISTFPIPAPPTAPQPNLIIGLGLGTSLLTSPGLTPALGTSLSFEARHPLSNRLFLGVGLSKHVHTTRTGGWGLFSQNDEAMAEDDFHITTLPPPFVPESAPYVPPAPSNLTYRLPAYQLTTVLGWRVWERKRWEANVLAGASHYAWGQIHVQPTYNDMPDVLDPLFIASVPTQRNEVPTSRTHAPFTHYDWAAAIHTRAELTYKLTHRLQLSASVWGEQRLREVSPEALRVQRYGIQIGALWAVQ